MILNHVFQAKSAEELNSCLKFMDTLIAYVFVPSGALTKFVATLARLVSIPSIVADAWKVNIFVRKLIHPLIFRIFRNKFKFLMCKGLFNHFQFIS